MKKNIFKSKTFWLNVLSVGAAVTGTLPPTAATAAVIGCLNIGLRAMTTEPVSVLPAKEE